MDDDFVIENNFSRDLAEFNVWSFVKLLISLYLLGHFTFFVDTIPELFPRDSQSTLISCLTLLLCPHTQAAVSCESNGNLIFSCASFFTTNWQRMRSAVNILMIHQPKRTDMMTQIIALCRASCNCQTVVTKPHERNCFGTIRGNASSKVQYFQRSKRACGVKGVNISSLSWCNSGIIGVSTHRPGLQSESHLPGASSWCGTFWSKPPKKWRLKSASPLERSQKPEWQASWVKLQFPHQSDGFKPSHSPL